MIILQKQPDLYDKLKNNNDLLPQNNNNNIQSYEKDIKVYILSREQIIEELKNGTRIKNSLIISAMFWLKKYK